MLCACRAFPGCVGGHIILWAGRILGHPPSPVADGGTRGLKFQELAQLLLIIRLCVPEAGVSGSFHPLFLLCAYWGNTV